MLAGAHAREPRARAAAAYVFGRRLLLRRGGRGRPGDVYRRQLIVPDVQSIGAGDYPGVLTPAFVVPGSILPHALSLRQLRRRSQAEATRR